MPTFMHGFGECPLKEACLNSYRDCAGGGGFVLSLMTKRGTCLSRGLAWIGMYLLVTLPLMLLAYCWLRYGSVERNLAMSHISWHFSLEESKEITTAVQTKKPRGIATSAMRLATTINSNDNDNDNNDDSTTARARTKANGKNKIKSSKNNHFLVTITISSYLHQDLHLLLFSVCISIKKHYNKCMLNPNRRATIEVPSRVNLEPFWNFLEPSLAFLELWNL